MIYNRCGNSGLKLPAISLGLWHNFSENDIFSNSEAIILHMIEIKWLYLQKQVMICGKDLMAMEVLKNIW